MTEKQYFELYKACDNVLISQGSSIERTAIAWLHILNEHPSNLKKYDDVFTDKSKFNYHRIKSLVLQLRNRVLEYRNILSNYASNNTCDVIFVSHLLNESQAESNDDFYFGNLPEILRDEGISSTVVLINHSRLNPKFFYALQSDRRVNRILLPSSLEYSKEFLIRSSLSSTAKFLLKESKLINDEFIRKVYIKAAKESLSYHSISSLRFYYQMTDILTHLKPKALVLTFEGHAWERLGFAAARKYNAKIKCIGYHHTILRPLNHSIKRGLGNIYDPDILFCTGKITKRLLERDMNLVNTKVNVLGVCRKDNSIAKLTLKDNFCLIAPVGLMEEALFLFEFGVECAKLMPQIRFLLRLHPTMTLKNLINNSKYKNCIPKNFLHSDKLLSDDFARCKWLLYKSSSVAVFAVKNNIRPIYIKQNNELNIDPLYELNNWRKIINYPVQVKPIIDYDIKNISEIYKTELPNAKSYCNNYFMPMNVELFKECILN